MKKTLLVTLALVATGVNSQVLINEYSGANVAQHANSFGEFSDWVELYNPTAGPIDVSGFHMSDRVTNPTKYEIPAGTIIAANGYLRVYCDSRNTVGGASVHTNFKLTQTAPEVIVFADPSGTILDQVTMIPCQPNHSRGRTTDGAATWSLFLVPTQGASNATQTAYVNYTARPAYNIQAGAYSSSLSITLTADAGSTIYYTLDGSVPTLGSPTYSVPLSVNSTTVIRSMAINTDPLRPPSFVETNTYLINENHILAVLSVCGDQVDDLLNGNGSIKPDTHAEYFDPSGTFRTEVSGTTNEHGNDSWAYAQRGFDLVSEDQYGINHGLTYKIFSRKTRDEFERVILKPAANDNYSFQAGGAHIRDAYVHTLSHDADLALDERTYEPCILYLNGQYWGVYEIREKVDDKDFTSYYYDQDEPNLYFLKTWGGTWEEYGAPNALAEWNGLRAFIGANTLQIQSNYDYVDSLLNTKSIMDYFILNSYVVCADWLNWNTAWWRGIDPNGDKKKWRYTLWDMDATFGHYTNYTNIPEQGAGANPCDPMTLGDVGGQGHVPILDSLMQNSGFREEYVNRYIDLNNTALSCDNMVNLLDSMIAVITPEMPRQITRWGTGSFAGWKTNVTTLRNYIIARCDSITEGMKDCYNLTGPYRVTFQTDPPGIASIGVNTVDFAPSELPFTGTYYGNITTDMRTEPVGTTDYEFEYWEITNVATPTIDSARISATFTTSQVVTAHYKIPAILYIPTAFSPNGDGVNDVFSVLGKGIKSVNMDVFDRWGEKVFSSSDKDLGWDGTFRNQKALPGVYAFRVFVEFIDGKSETKKGNVTLVR